MAKLTNIFSSKSVRMLRRALRRASADLKEAEQREATAGRLVAQLSARLNVANQWQVFPERLARIQQIVEEICEFHQLNDDLRRELLAAVHHGRAQRSVNTVFHVRVADAQSSSTH